MFRGFVEPTLAMVLKSLLCMSSAALEVHICLGRLLSALITAVGPELQDDSSISSMCLSFLLFSQYIFITPSTFYSQCENVLLAPALC